jgi:hypothetical protein
MIVPAALAELNYRQSWSIPSLTSIVIPGGRRKSTITAGVFTEANDARVHKNLAE